ncbi:exodeoxyribonuclease VII large subunit [Neptunicella marina]|uniref:Exodeoxyribonuclease 7 large subunit n=1 Tax=Neptunicella marina TaxID=2125989 RepID=A0A8J6J1F2_9ALTE|nr:exodeoxyribonuclease VII large subunit [Neptunicella marina]MBC3767876.1 exodeoxyribonuclease VII large subunit [Neptunicella marina]
MSAHQQNVFTVSKLNRLSRTILESEIGTIWVSAEISNFVKASSGHWYFTLKDKNAQIRAAMFKGSNRFVNPAPKEGEQVLVRANISLYEPRGDYQLIVEKMQSGGEGLLKQQFEQLKNRLHAEGLFDPSYKKPLPHTIKRVGIITSATGAALHDMLTVLNRRSPQTQIVIYPTQVQGQIATAQIVATIEKANFRNEVDVLLVGRGGGSLEDLWCFNQESVARAIFASNIPVISAVGHEVDVTIADFVADLRAPTPSAAAELVSQDQREQVNNIIKLQQRLTQATQQQLQRKFHQLNISEHQLQKHHPAARLKQQSQQIDHLQLAMHAAMQRILHNSHKRNEALTNRLSQQNPQHTVAMANRQLSHLTTNLQHAMQHRLKLKQQQLAEQAHLLNTLSPLTTLTRGFSITLTNGKVLKKADDVKSGDQLTTRLAEGEINSTVN